MRLSWTALGLLAAIVIAPGPVMATGVPPLASPASPSDPSCGPTSNILAFLRERYGERMIWWGEVPSEAPGGTTMILAQRPDGKTWTLLGLQGGEACMIASGGVRGSSPA